MEGAELGESVVGVEKGVDACIWAGFDVGTADDGIVIVHVLDDEEAEVGFGEEFC